jgi:hypothetical protein
MILAYSVTSDTDHIDANDVFIGLWETKSTRRLGRYLYIFRHIRALSLGDFDPIPHTDKHCNFLARCEGLVMLSLRDCRVVHNTVRRYVNGPDELPALVVISVDCHDFEAYM